MFMQHSQRLGGYQQSAKLQCWVNWVNSTNLQTAGNCQQNNTLAHPVSMAKGFHVCILILLSCVHTGPHGYSVFQCGKHAMKQQRREIFTATNHLLTKMHANFDSKPIVLVQSTEAQWSGCTAKFKAACELYISARQGLSLIKAVGVHVFIALYANHPQTNERQIHSTGVLKVCSENHHLFTLLCCSTSVAH